MSGSNPTPPSAGPAGATSQVFRRWLEVNGLTPADVVDRLEFRAHLHHRSPEELAACLRWVHFRQDTDPIPPFLVQAVFSDIEEAMEDALARVRRVAALHQAGADLAAIALREQGIRQGRPPGSPARRPADRRAADDDADGGGAPGPPRRRADNLTPRERQVLQLLGLGQSNRRISRCLGLSEKTVKNYLSSLFAKLAVADRTTAVLVALQHGYISVPTAASGASGTAASGASGTAASRAADTAASGVPDAVSP
ncbi:helix-turn-helix transcriptional regulator [Saccharothrix algeriensis]|uniref:DNA-binding NarL/FixJ family response regulator n=2 Tax=Saccharothrix algeriensis TaxID=173560 RepID=A0ABS2S3M0_9PSEU|nr:response regulator transcription factor [Saccharothrix algeriensis]MBM7809666.1 DNA-binding NarL/FixJ family response regulator [Saccharothrix algeriensis]